MSTPEGFKRLVLFKESSGCPALLGSSTMQDPLSEKEICKSCPSRREGLEVKGTVLVRKDTKADKGSVGDGLDLWNGTPACFHMAERAIILADKAPELAEKFGVPKPENPPMFRGNDVSI